MAATKNNELKHSEKYPAVPAEKTTEKNDQQESPHFDTINKEVTVNPEVEVAEDMIGESYQTERRS